MNKLSRHGGQRITLFLALMAYHILNISQKSSSLLPHVNVLFANGYVISNRVVQRWSEHLQNDFYEIPICWDDVNNDVSPASKTCTEVVVEESSSAYQKSYSSYTESRNSYNNNNNNNNNNSYYNSSPSTSQVYTAIRSALQTEWSSSSNIKFIGFDSCSSLSNTQAAYYVRINIHPSLTRVTTQTDTFHDTSYTGDEMNRKFKAVIKLPPWNSGNSIDYCITQSQEYNEDSASYQSTGVCTFDYSCVQSYALHCMGLTLGFMHEWWHPTALYDDTPCIIGEQAGYGNPDSNQWLYTASTSNNITYATYYDPTKNFTISSSPDPYSIMTFNAMGCSANYYQHSQYNNNDNDGNDDDGNDNDGNNGNNGGVYAQGGVYPRFGGVQPSTTDKTGMAMVYAPSPGVLVKLQESRFGGYLFGFAASVLVISVLMIGLLKMKNSGHFQEQMCVGREDLLRGYSTQIPYCIGGEDTTVVTTATKAASVASVSNTTTLVTGAAGDASRTTSSPNDRNDRIDNNGAAIMSTISIGDEQGGETAMEYRELA